LMFNYHCGLPSLTLRSSMVLNAIGNMHLHLKWQYCNSKILVLYVITIVIYSFCMDHM
jgi:hypothetical protein